MSAHYCMFKKGGKTVSIGQIWALGNFYCFSFRISCDITSPSNLVLSSLLLLFLSLLCHLSHSIPPADVPGLYFYLHIHLLTHFPFPVNLTSLHIQVSSSPQPVFKCAIATSSLSDFLLMCVSLCTCYQRVVTCCLPISCLLVHPSACKPYFAY